MTGSSSFSLFVRRASTSGGLSVFLVLVLVLSFHQSRGQSPALESVGQSERTFDGNQQARDSADLKEGDSVPALFDGEGSDLGPQKILAVQRRRFVEAVADSQLFYTDNFFQTDGDEVGASILVNTLQAEIAPNPYLLGYGELWPKLGFRQQWFNFGLVGNDSGAGFDYDDFDFYAQTAFLGAEYEFGYGWNVSLGLEAGRLVDSSGERYKEWVPNWGLQKYYAVGGAGDLRFGYHGSYHDSTDRSGVPPEFQITNHVDHELFGSLTWNLSDRFVTQAYYRFRYTDFESSGREDFSQTVGIGLYYFIHPKVSVRSFLSYNNRATQGSPIPDYDAFNLGGGLNLTISF